MGCWVIFLSLTLDLTLKYPLLLNKIEIADKRQALHLSLSGIDDAHNDEDQNYKPHDGRQKPADDGNHCYGAANERSDEKANRLVEVEFDIGAIFPIGNKSDDDSDDAQITDDRPDLIFSMSSGAICVGCADGSGGLGVAGGGGYWGSGC